MKILVTGSAGHLGEASMRGPRETANEAVGIDVLAAPFATHTKQAFIDTNVTGTLSLLEEDLKPIPKNIYGVTKLAAEDLCSLFHRRQGMPCIVLRTSRFFPERDELQALRHDFASAIEALREGRDHQSALARQVGVKGDHPTTFADGPCPVA